MHVTNASRRWPATLALTLLLSSGTAAFAQSSAGGRMLRMPPDSTASQVVRTVYRGDFSFVRIERAEAQATPGLHPVVVAPEVLRASLAALRIGKAADEPLFNDDELAEIVPPLVRALGELQPAQDIAFAVAGRHGGWTALAARTVTTGRMFRSSAGLHLIVGFAQRSFEGQFLATGYLIPFESGRRAATVDRAVVVAGAPPGGGAGRADWVTLALAPVPAATAAAPAAAAAAVPAAMTPAATAAAPVAGPAAAAGAVVPAAAAPARPRDAAYYEELEYRLRVFKRLRDSGLISEGEFQQKRREVLDKL